MITLKLNLKHKFTARFFLILASVCAISVASSIGQAQSGTEGGRLIVYRGSSFGNRLGLHVKIDGKPVASIVQGRNYDGFIPAGHHELTVLPVPRTGFRDQTSISLDVRPGQTYAFTAVWQSDQVVLRRASSSSSAR